MIASDLRYMITLEPAEGGTSRLVFHFVENMTNDSGNRVPIFPKGVVTEGTTDVPLALLGRTTSVDEICSFSNLTINGNLAFYKNDSCYLDPNTIRSCVTCEEIANPFTSLEISYTQKYLVNENDSFSREIRNPAKGAIVILHKPSSLITTLNWFGLSRGSFSTRVLENTLKTHSVEAVGTLMPGNGFEVYWQKIRESVSSEEVKSIREIVEETQRLVIKLSRDVATREDLEETRKLIVKNQEKLQENLSLNMECLKQSLYQHIDSKIGRRNGNFFWKLLEKISVASDGIQFAEYVAELVVFLSKHGILGSVLPKLLEMIH